MRVLAPRGGGKGGIPEKGKETSTGKIWDVGILVGPSGARGGKGGGLL